MEDDNIILIGGMLGNLANSIAETTHSIEMIQKLFANDRIVIEENYAENLVAAFEKLFVAINKCERGG